MSINVLLRKRLLEPAQSHDSGLPATSSSLGVWLAYLIKRLSKRGGGAGDGGSYSGFSISNCRDDLHAGS